MKEKKKTKTKIKAKKVGELEELSCAKCSYFMRVLGKMGICKARDTIVHDSFLCSVFKEGEPTRADLNTIAGYYLFFKETLEEAKRNKDILRDVLITLVCGTEETEDFEISVRHEVSRRLDTEKVKDYLEKQGVLEQFIKPNWYHRVVVKRKL